MPKTSDKSTKQGRHWNDRNKGYAGNTGLAKVAVSFFVGQFFLNLNFGASYES